MLSALALISVNALSGFYASPAGRQYASINPGGRTVLPNGRFLTPMGQRLYTGEQVWKGVLSPDGKLAAGFAESGVWIYDLTQNPPTRRIFKTADIAPAGVFSPDSATLYVSQGEKGKLLKLDVAAGKWENGADLNTEGVKDCYINDVVLSKDGRVAYLADVSNQQVVTVDLTGMKIVSRVAAGRQPYALTLSPDGKRLFVANIGVFDYTVVPKPNKPGFQTDGITRPPFGFPSKESEEGVEFEGRKIAGLGKPGTLDGQSIWSYELADGSPKLSRKAISGILMHSPAEQGRATGASAPNALLATPTRVFVANANNDTVSVFDAATLHLKQTFRLRVPGDLSNLRGLIPSGMALEHSGRRLFVCLSGINSVAVIDTATGKTLGHLPVGYFPVTVSLSPDERNLLVANVQGVGWGPRGALNKRAATDERFGLDDAPGLLTYLEIPSDLAPSTAKVVANNGLMAKPFPTAPNPMPYRPGKPSNEIKYVVFITKENHTFDGIFGELKGAKAQPEYTEFGMNGWIREKGKTERLPIMPNHVKLAKEYAISDNFYMEPGASGNGHRWLVGNYSSLWTQRLYFAGWNFKASDTAKGRLPSFGSNGSQIPEDYLENGSMWEHLGRHGISFRNYGEGFEFPGVDEGYPNSRSGAVEVVNFPMPKILFDNTCFEFPIFNMNIPDIARADWFIEDIEKNYRAKRKPLPKFMNIAICNDHGDGPKKELGYPYFSSFLADNDLALGQIVEYLSKQPEWKNMAIFVTQDDSGGDSDHIDRQRSFVLCISPFAKRGFVSHDHTCIISIIRSIYLLFGLPPNNMWDALATPLHDMLTTKPDYRPYKHVAVDPRVFRPQDTLDPNDPGFKKRRAAAQTTRMDDPDFLDKVYREGGGG